MIDAAQDHAFSHDFRDHQAWDLGQFPSAMEFSAGRGFPLRCR